MFNNKKVIAINALILAALLFGSTFIIVKNLLNDLSPTTVVFLRYLIASILFLGFGGIPSKEYMKPGILMGFFLWIGYITQTQGLLTTSTVNSGIVTGFYIVLTPIFSKFINKTTIERKNYIGSTFGFLGIFLIAINNIDQLFGNIFTLICASGYALHIVMVERYIQGKNISQLMFIQSMVGGLLCIPFLKFNEIGISLDFLYPILFLGLLVNFCAFYLQLFGQKFISASTASLLFGLEGVFALLIGVFYVEEILNIINWLGVFIVLFSIYYVIKE
jgi:drug/metabolite transporter (DMT)-like permease